MRKILFLFVFLCGCANTSISSSNNFSFADVSSNHIIWESILSLSEPVYFVFIYRLDCQFSRSIENEIVDFALFGREKVFFVNGSIGVVYGSPFLDTVGIDEIENLFIIGFPTLLLICKATVALQLTGAGEIHSFIDTYD
jgi:hypothetical protein